MIGRPPAYRIGDIVSGTKRITGFERHNSGRRYTWECTACKRPGGSTTRFLVKPCHCQYTPDMMSKPVPTTSLSVHIPSEFMCKLKHRALEKGWTVEVTAEEIAQLYLDQGKVCDVTGVPIGFKRNQTTASPDRIDGNKRYTRDNLRLTHKKINMMRGNRENDEFIWWCHQVARKNPCPPMKEEWLSGKVRQPKHEKS